MLEVQLPQRQMAELRHLAQHSGQRSIEVGGTGLRNPLPGLRHPGLTLGQHSRVRAIVRARVEVGSAVDGALPPRPYRLDVAGPRQSPSLR